MRRLFVDPSFMSISWTRELRHANENNDHCSTTKSRQEKRTYWSIYSFLTKNDASFFVSLPQTPGFSSALVPCKLDMSIASSSIRFFFHFNTSEKKAMVQRSVKAIRALGLVDQEAWRKSFTDEDDNTEKKSEDWSTNLKNIFILPKRQGNPFGVIGVSIFSYNFIFSLALCRHL